MPSLRSRVIAQAKKTAALRSRVIHHAKLGERAERLRKAYERNKAELADLRRQYESHKSRMLRLRAYDAARDLIGVMESGGNNRGAEVEKIIRGVGGTPGLAWCGYFVAYCYKKAGSKAVTWHWAAVRLLWPLAGIKRTSSPRKGDLVRFTFDHVGMYVADRGSEIETIEGNTGASGAVSDSATGGDGVYRKRRSKALVRDYLRVTR